MRHILFFSFFQLLYYFKVSGFGLHHHYDGNEILPQSKDKRVKLISGYSDLAVGVNGCLYESSH